MPNPVAIGEVLDVALTYILRRQFQGRPTTVRQVSKRIGLGISTVKTLFEQYNVVYVLFSQDEEWSSTAVEIAIRSMPEYLAERNGFTLSDIETSFNRLFGEGGAEKLEEDSLLFQVEPLRTEEALVLSEIHEMDPYHAYRIDTNQFKVMKPHLISLEDLKAEAKRKGYPTSAIMRAVGGDRMRYGLVSPVWRPYVYRNIRYYLKDVLNHLPEVFQTYKRPKTGQKKLRALQKQNLPPPVTDRIR